MDGFVVLVTGVRVGTARSLSATPECDESANFGVRKGLPGGSG